MPGHGSERPDDQARNPNREVSRRTWVDRNGGKFGMWDVPRGTREGLTIGADTLGGTSSIKVGGPAGSASLVDSDLTRPWRAGESNSKRTKITRPGPAEPYNREYGAQR